MERIVALCRRGTEPAPVAGMLLGSRTGRVVYRVLRVVMVRTAGVPGRPRFRLAYERLRTSDVPAGAEIVPCYWDRPSNAPRRPGVVPPPKPPVQEILARIAAGRRQERKRLAARIARFRRTDAPGADVGPLLRHEAARDRQGQVLREADVVVADHPDPANPRRTLRRACRADPLLALHRAGSITAREIDAAEELRRCLEWLMPSMGEANFDGGHGSAWDLAPVTDQRIKASRKVRDAAEALGERLWAPVLWVCSGGTVVGFAAYCRMRLATAGELVRAGMTALADHLFGAERHMKAKNEPKADEFKGQTRAQQVIFAVRPGMEPDDIPLLAFIMPQAAWEYMATGLGHEFDLTKIGLPIKVVIGRTATAESGMKLLREIGIINAETRDLRDLPMGFDELVTKQ